MHPHCIPPHERVCPSSTQRRKQVWFTFLVPSFPSSKSRCCSSCWSIALPNINLAGLWEDREHLGLSSAQSSPRKCSFLPFPSVTETDPQSPPVPHVESASTTHCRKFCCESWGENLASPFCWPFHTWSLSNPQADIYKKSVLWKKSQYCEPTSTASVPRRAGAQSLRTQVRQWELFLRCWYARIFFFFFFYIFHFDFSFYLIK